MSTAMSVGLGPQVGSVERPSQLMEAIGCIDTELIQLKDVIISLTAKLGPVMRDVSNDPPKQGEDKANVCSIATNLYDKARIVAEHREALQVLCARLEV